MKRKFLIILIFALVFSACAIDTPAPAALEPEPTEATPPVTEPPTLIPTALNESFCVDEPNQIMVQTLKKYFVSGVEYDEQLFFMPVTISNPYNEPLPIRLSDGFCKVWLDVPALSTYTVTADDARLKYGYVIIRPDGYYTIRVIPTEYGSGYMVAPRSIDPWNKYTMEEVAAYIAEFPDYVVPGYL